MIYVTMEEDFGVDELARKLLDAGFLETSTLSDILHHRIDEADENVTLGFEIDKEELVEHASNETLRDQLSTLGFGRPQDAEEAVRYVKAGEPELARTMFERVLDSDLMSGVERALRS
ncbi:hypothetical protein ACVOMT_11585 [Sphingomonas panni]